MPISLPVVALRDERVLRGPIVFTPSGEGYTFEAPTRFDNLFSGIVAPRPAFIPHGNAGTEHIGAEDTFDGDYGRLVEAVYGKWVASPSGKTDLYRRVRVRLARAA